MQLHTKWYHAALLVSSIGFQGCLGEGLKPSSAAPETPTSAPAKYSLTYNGNGNTGGTAPSDATRYSSGQTATVLGNTGSLIRNGTFPGFAGWNTAADDSGQVYRPGDSLTIGATNMTLYAIWGHLPDTGQTTSFTTGDDGFYTGIQPAFTDRGNGTLLDLVTGLFWQKCVIGLSGSDCATGTATKHNWFEATGTYDATNNPTTIDKCGALGTGWRLPSRLELMSLLNFEDSTTAINTTYFPATPTDTFYWTSTTYAGDAASAWIVGFATSRGWIGQDADGWPKTGTYYIRCVKSQ